MQPVFFVMAIMGCGDGSTACRDARIVPAQYQTMAQCRAALPNRLAENTDVPFPVIGAECRSVGQQIAASAGTRPRG